MSQIIQVEASLENYELNQCSIHLIFVLALLDHLVFYELSFSSLQTIVLFIIPMSDFLFYSEV